MACRRWWLGGLGAWLALLAVGDGLAWGQARAVPPVSFPTQVETGGTAFSLPRVPLELLPPMVRETPAMCWSARRYRPTARRRRSVSAGDVQMVARPPQRGRAPVAVGGAKVMEAEDRGNGHFGWHDGETSDVEWMTVLDTPNLRVWYVEGKAKPGLLVPTVYGKALVVVSLQEARRAGPAGASPSGPPPGAHYNRALVLIARMMGATRPPGRELHEPVGDVLRRPGLVSRSGRGPDRAACFGRSRCRCHLGRWCRGRAANCASGSRKIA